MEHLTGIIQEAIIEDHLSHPESFRIKFEKLLPDQEAEFSDRGIYVKASYQGSELISIDGFITPIGVFSGITSDDPKATKRISSETLRKFRRFAWLIEVQDLIGWHTIDPVSYQINCQWGLNTTNQGTKIYLIYYNDIFDKRSRFLNPNPNSLYVLSPKK
jgi:hypothetical protein